MMCAPGTSLSRSPTPSICTVYTIGALAPCPTGSVIGLCLLLMLQIMITLERALVVKETAGSKIRFFSHWYV